jgi:hypothetical protein
VNNEGGINRETDRISAKSNYYIDPNEESTYRKCRGVAVRGNLRSRSASIFKRRKELENPL